MPDTAHRKPVPCSDVTILLAYEAGRRDTYLEAAQALEMKPSEIRLHAGELSAQEMRAVQAVLRWKAAEFRRESNE